MQLFFEVPVPADFSSEGIEAEDVSFSAEGVNHICVDGGCGEGTGGCVALEVEAAFVGMSPNLSTGVGIEAVDNIVVGVGVVLFAGVAHSIEPAIGDGYGGTAESDVFHPEGFYALGFELVGKQGLS